MTIGDIPHSLRLHGAEGALQVVAAVKGRTAWGLILKDGKDQIWLARRDEAGTTPLSGPVAGNASIMLATEILTALVDGASGPRIPVSRQINALAISLVALWAGRNEHDLET